MYAVICVVSLCPYDLPVTSPAPALSASLQGVSSAVTSLNSVVAMTNQAGRLNASVVVAMDTSRLASLTIPSNFATGDGGWSLVFQTVAFLSRSEFPKIGYFLLRFDAV